ncbi:DMT family transporter [Benzoatithermus flavus]|uniref:DMT family transporter n=1 Tax=Benzoatithermus flavus TaxID=3108223 RepID=A0ABU8XPZ8_9PROT
MTIAAAASARAASVVRGIGFAVLCYACFSTGDAVIKLASTRFSVFQIAFTLALFALIPVVGLTAGQGGIRAFLPRRWGLVILRGALTATGSLLAWRAFGLLPLADGYGILFAAPMLVTGLSALLLGEEVGWRRWAAALVGFVGVLVMIRPDFATLGLGHLLAALAALTGALGLITLRKIGTSETSASILLVVFLSLVLVTAPMVPATFVLPTWRELGLLALAGLLMGCGQAGLVLATREAPAVVVAPFQYTQMIWGILFGALLFGDRPAPVLFVGMALVVGSGLYTLWRETVRRKVVSLGSSRGEVPARAAR